MRVSHGGDEFTDLPEALSAAESLALSAMEVHKPTMAFHNKGRLQKRRGE